MSDFQDSRNTPNSILQSVIAITSQRDRGLLARTLVSTLADLIQSHRIAMYRILPGEQAGEALLVAETAGQPDLPEPEVNIAISSRADFSSVLRSGKEYMQALSNNTFLSIYPIIDQHGVAGLLKIVSNTHSSMDKHLILAFLKVYGNYISILDESETDTLTGLLNRRTFDNNIDKIIAESPELNMLQVGCDTFHPARRMKVGELPHWLAVMDIDFFKRINDNFGHLYGDEVLLLFARTMQRIFRQRDRLYRFGGEEFIVVLDRTSEENAKRVLERFRSTIEHYDFPQVGKVTISIGFIKLDKSNAPSSIVGHADQALYYAKEHGRNQVCYYDELVVKGELEGERYSDDIQLF